MRKHFIFYLFLLFVFGLKAATPLDDFLNNPALRNANVGFQIKCLDDDKVVAEHAPTHSFMPASTMKLVTTATALELLGADFKFETRLQIEGEIEESGILNGNLYIYGGGDPTLGSEFMGNRDFLKQWVRAIQQAGIKSINGSIVADPGLFDDEGINPKWSWEDIGNYYAAAVYGISYMDNTVRVYFDSGNIGSTPVITKTVPNVPGLQFQNNLKCTAIAKDSAYFYGAPHSNVRTVYGEIPANRKNFVSKADNPNPGLLLATHFHDLLIDNGVNVSYPPLVKSSKENNRRTIYIYYSPSLGRIVREINFTSNNHYTEHIFRYLALQNSTVASTDKAISVIRGFWKSKGLPVEQLFMSDGSGLSRSDAVSAQFFVSLLSYMRNESANSKVFYNSLPVAGESGTIAWILKNTALSGKVHAKSGSISYVRAYAGYINWNQKTYAFSILVNNYSSRPNAVIKQIERLLLNTMTQQE
ncbi:D-alanyl-D-alanine carboxypeptidase/D-alanyl-D-alanine-endopeptidase [Paludibacter sp. 221]|uniref:D-alanyl-D-alanine carboxypeptidase/D-alanyl-D-alanine endopeptidase n=1 Tax=Paludibacter sp. 221 TaxID=2302939 RepID=UPI0013D8BAE8|nr:D-alanyl-D-alanine carboxypeptidase/D-alanyl-D-alanine-endopeptidase [Paludibacter sp. 221]NDV46852.1 D-alanyl-D-alanine carboxypeptidase/D-alanyl-D-alanine-endopeptidase [Paludibacter sp. 221]